MKKLLLTISLLSISVSALMILPVSAPNGPHLSKVEFRFESEWERVTQMTKTPPDFDECPDLIRPWDVVTLAIAGKKILYTPGGHLASFVFNLRNYTDVEPYGAGYPHEYGKRFLLDPWFRLAIAYLTPKAMLIGMIFNWIAVRVDSVVPPQLARYHNPGVGRYEYDPAKAVQTLLDHGYIRVGSAPTWYWAYADGTPLANIAFLSPTIAEAPDLFRIVATTVGEMSKIGLTNVKQTAVPFVEMLLQYVHPQYFDMCFLCWTGIGPDPDYLWDFFNSANDAYEGRNHPGLHDPYIDYLTDIVHTSLDYLEVWAAAMEIQELLADPTKPYGLCYIPVYSRIFFNAYQPDLEGIVIMSLTGSDNCWTFLNTRWKPGTGHKGNPADNRYICPLTAEIFSLNPLATSWAGEVETLPMGAYQEELMNRVFDRLMNKDPYTLEDIYWLAEYREIAAYSGTPGGGVGYVEGMRYFYRLRSGLTWQDGEAFDTSDIKFAFDYMNWAKPGLWVAAWEDYVGTKIISPTEVEIYYNQTSLWQKDTVETVATMLPEHIWGDENGDGTVGDWVADWQHFNIWQEEHTDHTIPGTTLTMKKLFGMGSCYFYQYDVASMLAELYPNPNYHKSQAEISAALADMFYWSGDITKDGIVDDADLTELGLGWGAIYPEARYISHKDADIVPARNPDGYIDIEDASRFGRSWGKKIWY